MTVTFTWASGDDAPPLGYGSVTVSYHPVSDDDDDNPRYVSGPTNMAITVADCTTTLMFPYVVNKSGFETGLVITNTSEEDGSCTIEYSGKDEPSADLTAGPVEGGEQWIALASNIAPEFQGYITATCGFRNAYGFAFVSNGFGGGSPTAGAGLSRGTGHCGRIRRPIAQRLLA